MGILYGCIYVQLIKRQIPIYRVKKIRSREHDISQSVLGIGVEGPK